LELIPILRFQGCVQRQFEREGFNLPVMADFTLLEDQLGFRNFGLMGKMVQLGLIYLLTMWRNMGKYYSVPLDMGSIERL